jgi:hypothetical protein
LKPYLSANHENSGIICAYGQESGDGLWVKKAIFNLHNNNENPLFSSNWRDVSLTKLFEK